MKFGRKESKPENKELSEALLLALSVGTVSKKGEIIKISCNTTNIEEIDSLQRYFIIDSLYGENDYIVISLTMKN